MSVRVHDGLPQLTFRLLHQLECLGAVPTIVMRGALELTPGVRERSRRRRDVWVLAAAPIRAARLPVGAARWRVGRERDRPRTEHQPARERDRWKPDLSSHVRPPETLTPAVARTRGR